jgi:FkbM family methyltransferase
VISYKLNIQETNANYYINSAATILDRFQGEPGVLVDIGAHVGILDLLAVSEGGFRIAAAIEANMYNFVRMVDNIVMNECEGRILPIWAAVTNRSYQTETLYSNNLGINSGIQSLKYKDTYPSESVVGISFHDALAGIKKVDLLKIDIEGGEWDILVPKFAKDFKKCDWIDIELHVAPVDYPVLYKEKMGSVDTARKFLTDCGFELYDNPETDGFYGPRK